MSREGAAGLSPEWGACEACEAGTSGVPLAPTAVCQLSEFRGANCTSASLLLLPPLHMLFSTRNTLACHSDLGFPSSSGPGHGAFGEVCVNNARSQSCVNLHGPTTVLG